jgi:hypothetical protein
MSEQGKKAAPPTDEAGLRELIRQEVRAVLAEQLPALLKEQLAHLQAAPALASTGSAVAGQPVIVAPAPPKVGRPSAKTVALISAAVVAAMTTRSQVRRITFLNRNTISGWVEAGRITIQSSHTLRRSL